MEKHSAYLIPREGGDYTLYTPHQYSDLTHEKACLYLGGISKNKLELIMKRGTKTASSMDWLQIRVTVSS